MNISAIKEKIKSIDRKMIYGISAAVGILVISVGYMIPGTNNTHANQATAEEPLRVSAVTVEPEPVEDVISASGTLTSKNTSVLSSKIMGRVSYIGVNEGDYVNQGRLLIKIESGEIAAQIHQAQAAYNNARIHFDRIKRLYDEHAATQMEMDHARLGLETAEAGLNAAKAMESYTTISAPISGLVVEKRINHGEMALPGQPLIRIDDNKNLRLEVALNEQNILSVEPGETVRVSIDAMPDRVLMGRVSSIVPQADSRTRSFIVKIDIPAEKGLITGMYGKALFSKGNRDAILVPKSSVVTMAGVSGVYIMSPEGTALFQMVQLGQEYGDKIEVLAGLKAGDRVITGGLSGRINGRNVVLAQN